MTKRMIYQDYEKTGRSSDQLRRELRRLKNRTSWVKIHSWQIHLLSFKSMTDIEYGDNGDIKRSYNFYVLDKEALENQAKINTGFPEVPVRTVMRGGRPNDNTRFLDEIVQGTGVLVELIDKKGDSYYYGLSESALPTFATQAGLKGNRIRENSLFRDAYIAQGYLNAHVTETNGREVNKRIDRIIGDGFTLAIRKTRAQRKEVKNTPKGTGIIIAAFGGDYVGMEPDILIDIFDMFKEDQVYKKAELTSYHLTQEYAHVNFEFPALGEELKEKYKTEHTLIPGVQLKNSDCGLSSLTIQGTLRIEESDTLIETFHQKERHGDPLDKERLEADIKRELIQSYEKVAARIAVLEKKKLEKEKRKQEVEKIVSSAIGAMPSANKVLGLKRRNILRGVMEKKAGEMGDVFTVIREVLDFPKLFEEHPNVESLGETAAMYWLQESQKPLNREYHVG